MIAFMLTIFNIFELSYKEVGSGIIFIIIYCWGQIAIKRCDYVIFCYRN